MCNKGDIYHIEFLYTLHPYPPIGNILKYDGTFVTVKKLAFDTIT